MRRKYIKFSLAVLIASIGVFMVARLLWTQLPQKEPAAIELEIQPVVAKVIHGDFDTTPTEETVEADINRATRQAESMAGLARSIALPAPRRSDLALAFKERLSRVINPSYMRDLRARASRGQQVEIVEPDQEKLDNIEKSDQFFALLPMDIQSLEVRPIYERGVPVARSAVADGFGELTTRLTGDAFPMADLDPVEDLLDIVEVRLPMKVPVPPPGEGKTERCLIGFQFVWSKERKQWIPWANKTYSDPNHGSYGVPF